MKTTNSDRSIHWLDSARRAIRASVPEAGAGGDRAAVKLAGLFLEKLPADLASELLKLLPDHSEGEVELLRAHISAGSSGEPSIGYIQFVEISRLAIGRPEPIESDEEFISSGRQPQRRALSRRVADAFLWTLGGELPPELKIRIVRTLPSELRSRMNIYGAHSTESKVA